jgi:hypothetical protein
MERRKREWKPFCSKNQFTTRFSEENRYPVPDLNKIMINITKEPSDTHIKALREEILEDVTEKFMVKTQTWLTRM